jgi:uncharacterized SAM-binding protein YcdF (DUF218 family)
MTYPSDTIRIISEFLFIESKIEKVDLIFVFGNDWLKTMDHVSDLYYKGISSNILITGHSANKDRVESEADRFSNYGISLGIPQNAFLLEKCATNTKENLEFSIPIIESKLGLTKIKKILFVCKTFHTRRVLMTAQKWLPSNIQLSFYPVNDERNILKHNWWKTEETQERVMGEIRRIGEYTLQGDLSLK